MTRTVDLAAMPSPAVARRGRFRSLVPGRTAAGRSCALVVGVLAWTALLAGTPVRAEETPEDPVVAAARRVAEAAASGDREVLRAIAGDGAIDPWLVADLLCAQGLGEAAGAWSTAVSGPDTAGLADYVGRLREAPTPPGAREVVAAASGAEARKAFALLEGAAASRDVTGVRLLRLRAKARPVSPPHPSAESARDLTQAADLAEGLGWISQAFLCHLEAGALLRRLEAHEEARAAYDRALTLARRRDDVGGEAEALEGLGRVLAGAGDRAAGLASLERSLALREQVGKPGPIAEALRQLANLAQRGGDRPRARRLLDRSLEVERAADRRVGAAESLRELGRLDVEEGRLQEAEARLTEALPLFKEIGAEDRVLVVAGLLGTLCEAQNRHEEAVGHMERALRAARSIGSELMEATLLNDLGNVHQRAERLDEAAAAYERAHALHESAGNARMAATALVNLALVKRERGDRDAALGTLTRALAMLERVGDVRGIAAALQNIATIHMDAGDYPRATEQMERALRAHEKSGNRDGMAGCLTNLGAIHMRLGDPERAVEAHRCALALREGMPDRSLTAFVWHNLGIAYRDLGDVEKALECLQRSLSLFEELGQRRNVALALGNIGIVHSDAERHDEALRWAERALRLREDLGEHGLAASTMTHIGNIHLARSDFETALAWFARAHPLLLRYGAPIHLVSLLQSQTQAHLWAGRPAEALAVARTAIAEIPLLVRGLSEEEGPAAREQWGNLFDAGVAAAAAVGDVRALHLCLESSRAGALLESLGGRDALRALAVPEELQAEETAARAAVLAAQDRMQEATTSGERQAVRSARAALEEARRSMLEVVGRIQRSGKARAGLAYPKARALEEVQARLEATEALVSFALLDRVVALVVTRQEARLVALARREDLPAADGPLAPWRAALVETLGLPPEVSRVLISPDGDLAFLPMSVLFEGKDVVYVPSATTWMLLGEEETAPGEGVLALGDPLPAPGATPALPRLPASGEEARAVGDVVLLGEAATPAGWEKALGTRPRWRAVHLACHGVLDARRPLLSHLVFSGGTVSAHDLLRTRVPADLVVLSACETARGRAYGAEGVVGFVRACLFAGAPRVIVSLWKVDDEATRALMVAFHERWRNGMSAARALREAQALVAASPRWKDPRFWAAWQLWGLP